ncbi:hypothetical protein [Tenacibaculum sp. SDUM215027]|uniref:hypothetical protein n=1 Tax=Tenacibaculum sp. SDUM215027 TaxID=3422596 RepID=UPI003D312D6B
MKNHNSQFLFVLLFFATLIACKDGNNKSSETKHTVLITQPNKINGTYNLSTQRKEGDGDTYITSRNPSVINHELELKISKNEEDKYVVELKDFTIQVPAPICSFVYNTRVDTTRYVSNSFGVITFEKEKQEQLNKVLKHYKKLKGNQFLFERTSDGNFKLLSGKISWEDYKNKVDLRHGDPIQELKMYMSPDYLTMVLNQTFNYAEGDFISNTTKKNKTL